MSRASSGAIRWWHVPLRPVERVWLFWGTPGAGRLALCSIVVGIVSGLGAVAFLVLLRFMIHHVLGDLMGLHMPAAREDDEFRAIFYPTHWWWVLLIPTVGGLISGWIVFTWAPEAEGHGTDAMIRAFHRGEGQIRGRVPLIKSIASVITIGTGGSAGQEGPIAQIGAGFGSVLARFLRLSTDERRLLMLAGVSGGIGAIFRAPLGGALFASEVLYSTAASESPALLPCLFSSITAYSVFALFITPKPIFAVPRMDFGGLTELPLYVILALVCTVVGWVYIKVFYGMRDYVFHPLPIPQKLKPALGGLLVGIIALWFPQVMAGGYGWVQWGAIGEPIRLLGPNELEFVPNLSAWMLLLLAFLKILATSLSISSGGSGGVFGPSVFIGGVLGGAVGQFLAGHLPGWHVEPAAFAMVGMAGFFAGVSKTPVTTILMVCEMAGSYSLLVPLMLVSGLHVALSSRWTLYEEQVPSPIDSPAHQGEYVIDILDQIRLKELPIRTHLIEKVPEALPLSEVVQRVADSSERVFPVVDGNGRLTGIFTLEDVRWALLGLDVGPLVLAAELGMRPVPAVTPEDDLHTVLRRMTELNAEEVPVVQANDSGQLIGLFSRRELQNAYDRRIRKLRGAL